MTNDEINHQAYEDVLDRKFISESDLRDNEYYQQCHRNWAALVPDFYDDGWYDD